MRTSSNGVSEIVVGLVQLILIGWVIYELLGAAGASIVGMALWPTVASLSLIWLFLGIRLVIKSIRLRSGVVGSFDPSATEASDPSATTEGFDADAAFANYMRNRDAAPPPPIATDAVDDDLRPFTPRPGGFGRKAF